MLITSRMNLLLTLYVRLLIIWIKCLQIYGLDKMFGNLRTGGYDTTGWRSRSPNVAPQDAFFCERVKDDLYRTFVHSLRQRNQRITTAIRTVTQETFNNV